VWRHHKCHLHDPPHRQLRQQQQRCRMHNSAAGSSKPAALLGCGSEDAPCHTVCSICCLVMHVGGSCV
jgi:hypothetical protein